MGVQSKLDIKKQLEFIDLLYDKLKKDINKSFKNYSSNDIYYGLDGRTRMQNDIIKIRRELMDLSNMLNRY